jgi:hypothetical protein
MSSYHQHSFKLSPLQLRKLKAGNKIRLQNSALDGSNVLFLTATQMNKLNKAKKAGKGMELMLSGSQLSHNIKHGGSIWGDIFSKVKDGLSSAASFGFDNIIKPTATKLLTERVAPAISKKLKVQQIEL